MPLISPESDNPGAVVVRPDTDVLDAEVLDDETGPLTREDQIRAALAAGVSDAEVGRWWGVSARRIREIATGPQQPAVPERAHAGERGPLSEIEPPMKELMLRGRIAMTDTTRNPDDWVDAETAAMMETAIPENTLKLMWWALGAALWWQDRTGREIWPMTPGSMRVWIKDHWTMKRADGRLRGRGGRPYSPRTVETRIYLMTKIWKLKGFVSPVRHPKVQLQLRAYRKMYEAAGHTADVAYAITHEDSVAMARACRLTSAAGLRNAAALRLQFDTGLRASELLALRVQDVTFERPDDAGSDYQGPLNAVLHIRRSKTDQDAAGRHVGVEAVPDVDGDVDPAVLLARLVRVLGELGHTSGPLWVETSPPGKERLDGGLGGKFYLDKPWSYDAYESAVLRAAKKSGVYLDPQTKRPRRITSHSMRAGHVTDALDHDEPIERVALRTGHSPTGSIHGYYRNRRRFGRSNTGAQIRRTRRRGTPT